MQKYFDCSVKEATNNVVKCLGLESSLGFNNISHPGSKGTKNSLPNTPVSKKVRQLRSRSMALVVNVHNQYVGTHFIEPDGRCSH